MFYVDGLITITKEGIKVFAPQNENQSMLVTFRGVTPSRRKGNDGNNTVDGLYFSGYGRTAEFLQKNAQPGSRFYMRGRLEETEYDGKDGQKHYGYRCVLDNVEFAERKADSTQAQYAAPAPAQGQYAAPPAPAQGQYTAPPAPAQGQYTAPPAPAQGQYAAPPYGNPQYNTDGFMNIPDAVDNDLPWK